VYDFAIAGEIPALMVSLFFFPNKGFSVRLYELHILSDSYFLFNQFGSHSTNYVALRGSRIIIIRGKYIYCISFVYTRAGDNSY